MKPISEETVNEFRRLCSFGLVKGLGKPEEGNMCIEAAIAKAHNLPHQDKNYCCIDKDVVNCEISLNVCNWSSNENRAKGMIKLGIAQLGSNKLKEGEFTLRIKLNSMKMIIPFLIQKHYYKTKDKKLLEYKQKFENLVELDDTLWKEFYNYNNYYYNYNIYYSYNNYYNNYYNDYYYYNDYHYCFGEEFLLLIAKTILKTLQELNVEGCKYLYLVKPEESLI